MPQDCPLERRRFQLDTAPTQPGLPPGHSARSSDGVEVGEPDEVEETKDQDELGEPVRSKLKSSVGYALRARWGPTIGHHFSILLAHLGLLPVDVRATSRADSCRVASWRVASLEGSHAMGRRGLPPPRPQRALRAPRGVLDVLGP